jgi:hypothetical protein
MICPLDPTNQVQVVRNGYEGLNYGAVPMALCLKGMILTTVVEKEEGTEGGGDNSSTTEPATEGGGREGEEGEEGEDASTGAVVGGRARDLPEAQAAFRQMTAYGKKRR